MSTIFSTYAAPQIKEINYPGLLQESKLNIDDADYEKYMKANMYIPSKKILNRVDNHKHCPA